MDAAEMTTTARSVCCEVTCVRRNRRPEFYGNALPAHLLMLARLPARDLCSMQLPFWRVQPALQAKATHLLSRQETAPMGIPGSEVQLRDQLCFRLELSMGPLDSWV